MRQEGSVINSAEPLEYEIPLEGRVLGRTGKHGITDIMTLKPYKHEHVRAVIAEVTQGFFHIKNLGKRYLMTNGEWNFLYEGDLIILGNGLGYRLYQKQ